MKAKRWIVREHDAERAASLARVLGVSPILAALLLNRGYADERRHVEVLVEQLQATLKGIDQKLAGYLEAERARAAAAFAVA